MDCVRRIVFMIPGVGGAPDVQVTAVENEGTIEFTVEVLTTDDGATADLRALFFDLNEEATLAGLAMAGPDVTEYATGDVIDLGQGANMHGAADPFDAGVEFGGPGIGKDKLDVQTTTFVLTNDAGDLTLDDIAHVEFGARLTSIGPMGEERGGSSKQTTISPAAPDANDDVYSIFEDGQSGLDDPSSVSEGVQFDVLDNDTDADGDTLTVTHVFGATHGTVEIIDGDDPDLLPGDAILYTPYTDYAGTDEFTYCITDNNGGTDYATVFVTVEAVADIPDVSIEAYATQDVNVIRLVVTATQTDDDASEFIDSIVASGLPANVTLSPALPVDPLGQPTQLVQEYFLTLPLDQDHDFDLTFTATSQEVSNGDTETGSATIDIDYEYNQFLNALQFESNDQSIWGSGDAFVFEDDRFLGFDTGNFDNQINAGPFYAGLEGHLMMGFQSTLIFEGGSIDATADYDITVETNYNKTVDELLIDTGALLTDAEFWATGPSGSYTLDFLWDLYLRAYAGVEISFGELGSLDERINFPAIDIGPGSFNIIDIQSEDLSGSFDFPSPFDVLSIGFDWPELETHGEAPPLNPVADSDASDNFLELGLDIDQLIFTLAGLPNPFNPGIDIGPFYAELDILNVFATAGMNLLQDIEMQMGDLVGVLSFEDGSNSLFTIGDSLQLSNASAIDAAGDGDGNVEFDFTLIPESDLTNLTELGFNVGGGVEILSAEAGYDIFGFSDSVGFGPLFEFGFTQPIAAVDVFDETFDLAFESETFSAYA